MGILTENFRAWAKGRGTEFTIKDVIDSKIFDSQSYAHSVAREGVHKGWLVLISNEGLGVYMWTAGAPPFLKDRPVKMIALWKIHKILHTKRSKVRAKYKEVTLGDNPKTGYIHMPMFRNQLVGADSAIADILDKINELE